MKQFNIKTTHIIALLVGVILLLVKCNRDYKNELKSQNFISQNNIEVLNDSIKSYTTKNGALISERGVLIADKDNLKSLNKKLYNEVQSLSKVIPNVKPSVAVQWKTNIIHDTIYINSNSLALNDSTYLVKFNKDTIYDENNYRQISGSITIDILSDSSKYNKLKVSDVTLSKDIVNMEASLVLGMKDDKLKVWLKTDYPGLKTDEIDAVILDPDIHPELRKLNNKKYSVGPYIGFGVSQGMNISPSVGICLQYSLFKF